MTGTVNTRVDAVVRIVEDFTVVAGTGAATWFSTHNAHDSLAAMAAAPVARSAIAAALSSGRVSGLLLALRLVKQALGFLDAIPAAAPAPPPPVTPAPETEALAAAVAEAEAIHPIDPPATV